ncbi:MAG: type I phosphomannose isomerase catalytic subunit [Rikenellaceae bacterium]
MYPLKFKGIYKERIWGGEKLATEFGKKLPKSTEPIGESWEISGVEGDVSCVANGTLRGNSLNELIEIYMDELVGDSVFKRFGEEFPLLIKLIDAQDNLSIQVHPDDELAASRHNAYGKTEMWHIISAEEGAQIYLGFKEDTTRERYIEYLNAGKLEELLNSYSVKAGETYFIPAGAIHAIGRGVLLAEIQQTSDITYRVYDFNRLDSEGKARELHTELAVDAISYEASDAYNVSVEPVKGEAVEIQSCKYFTSELRDVQGSVEIDLAKRDSFTIFICLEGSVEVLTSGNDESNNAPVSLSKGESILIGACHPSVMLTGNATLLGTYINH